MPTAPPPFTGRSVCISVLCDYLIVAEGLSVGMEALQESSGTIASRFETQTTIDQSKAMREKEWKEAYARLGQEPPKRDEEPVHDGRTLYEKLQTQKALKTEEWDVKMKLSNQYRGLDEEEQRFLAEKARERREAEKKREEEENVELLEYREALASKHAAPEVALPTLAASTSSVPKKVPPRPVKKDVKSLMKGVVVKKKPKPPDTVRKTAAEDPILTTSGSKRAAEEVPDTGEDGKKLKIAPS
ncbi:N-terminal domain of NEFA-interacting nuclear protein NIP30-domain-containing protein [Naematelia encephala]|uniref:N-terminal domain of NEFA-interacting nuclear protein NIP30-domain-containing protein n=1 Tax=Naematelia encephala TaxID=71784 RepID=A0A1Y2AUL3_9TREE|nr:N-terminal domain of NEFA-interacting nuclear protein NIP30-domain-containing protein [Naematelia encephala]